MEGSLGNSYEDYIFELYPVFICGRPLYAVLRSERTEHVQMPLSHAKARISSPNPKLSVEIRLNSKLCHFLTRLFHISSLLPDRSGDTRAF